MDYCDDTCQKDAHLWCQMLLKRYFELQDQNLILLYVLCKNRKTLMLFHPMNCKVVYEQNIKPSEIEEQELKASTNTYSTILEEVEVETADKADKVLSFKSHNDKKVFNYFR